MEYSCENPPPKTTRMQIVYLLCVGVTMMVFATFYCYDKKTYIAPDPLSQITLDGWVSGYADEWRVDKSLLQFGVSYRLQGVLYGKAMFAYKDAFDQLGLRIGSKVRLTVEDTEQGVTIRQMATQQGRILFDDRMNRQIVTLYNEQSTRLAIFCIVVAIPCFVFAALVAWRSRGR